MRWSGRWVSSVATADVSLPGCEIEKVPVNKAVRGMDASFGDWLLS